MLRIPTRLFSFALGALAVLAQEELEHNLTSAGIYAVFADDQGYADVSAPFNLRYDFAPVAVTYPSSTAEVAAIVAAGFSENYQVVARSGGHSYIANGLGGKDGVLVIDFSNMTAVSYDSSTGFATLEPGLRLGDVALALNASGRALPHGTCPYVGLGGHAASGGFGFTSRLWGLTVDTIQEMEVVLANGTVVTASNDINVDLFWAMRGAAPSFGIITSFVVQTFPAPTYATVFQYSFSGIDASTGASMLVAFQNFWHSDVEAAIGMELVLSSGASEGLVGFAISGGYYGESEATLDATIKPLLDALPAYSARTLSGDGTYIGSVIELGGGVLNTHDAKDTHDTFYAKSLMTPESEIISLKAATAFMKYLSVEGYHAGTSWFLQPEVYGGTNSKINSLSPDATSFGSRNSLLAIQFYTSSGTDVFPDDGFTFLDDMVATITDAMGAEWDYGAYYNYPDDRLQNWEQLYYRDNYARLATLKEVYDPTGVFNVTLTVGHDA